MFGFNGFELLPSRLAPPPWSRVEGKHAENFRGMLSDSGSILRGVHSFKMPFALMLSPGWPAVSCPPGLGFRGFQVEGIGFKVSGVGLVLSGLGFRVQG